MKIKVEKRVSPLVGKLEYKLYRSFIEDTGNHLEEIDQFLKAERFNPTQKESILKALEDYKGKKVYWKDGNIFYTPEKKKLVKNKK